MTSKNTPATDPGVQTGFPIPAACATDPVGVGELRWIFFLGALSFLIPNLCGQEVAPSSSEATSPASLPVKLDISRRSLNNFLTDDEALAPYRSIDGKIRELTGVFMLGSESAPFAVFWDSHSCRLLGVLDITRPAESEPSSPAPGSNNGEGATKTPSSPYVLKASGPSPLSGASGSPANPVYFGFRLVDGKPEFLYTSGPLEVEERIWLEEGGNFLKQRFSVRNAAKGFRILLPSDWKERVTVSSGTWKNETLTVPAESAGELILTYRLTDPEPEPADSN